MDQPFGENPWSIIETGDGEDEEEKYTYYISYNKVTGERPEEGSYYFSNR